MQEFEQSQPEEWVHEKVHEDRTGHLQVELRGPLTLQNKLRRNIIDSRDGGV